MREVISISLNDNEQDIINRVSTMYENISKGALIKQLAFEKLEDIYDLNDIAEYEEKKASGKLKLHSHEDVWGDLG